MKIRKDVSVELLNSMGDDMTPAEAARVSFDAGKYEDEERNIRLMDYLSREMHFTPFGHIFLSFKIEAPMMVARQLFRHGYLRISEVSMRYVKGDREFFLPTWRSAPKGSVKQGSGPEIEDDDLLSELDRIFLDSIEVAHSAYTRLLDLGVAPEQARAVLPVATYVKWVWSGSMDAFYRMWSERTGEGAQKETKSYAETIGTQISERFPNAWGALTKYKTVRTATEEN